MSQEDQEQQEATIPDENTELELDLEDAQETEDVEALRAKAEKMNNFARQAVARAKKAEAEVKALKQAKPQEPANQPITKTLSPEDVEEKILYAQGRTEEQVQYLKKIAAVNGTTLIQAQKDELFENYVSKQEAEAKARKASLGASRGGGTVKAEKGIGSPGLTDAEHKELWKQQNGR